MNKLKLFLSHYYEVQSHLCAVQYNEVYSGVGSQHYTRQKNLWIETEHEIKNMLNHSPLHNKGLTGTGCDPISIFQKQFFWSPVEKGKKHSSF